MARQRRSFMGETSMQTTEKASRWSAYLLGLASIFDFSNALTPPRRHLQLPTAYEAIRADWEAVGSDIARAMQRFAAEHPEALR
jgi:hypothetical protein